MSDLWGQLGPSADADLQRVRIGASPRQREILLVPLLVKKGPPASD